MRVMCLVGAMAILAFEACKGSPGETSDTATMTDSSSSSTGLPECALDPPMPGGVHAPWGSLSAGVDHMCVLVGCGAVRCWGVEKLGSLGYGLDEDVGDDEVPSSLPPLVWDRAALQVDAGWMHTCALLEDGRIACWGRGDMGSLGSGFTDILGDDELATSVPPISLGSPAVQVVAGGLHTCAILDNGSVYCWGAGEYGLLGSGNTENIGDDEAPDASGPVALGGKAVQLSSTYLHTCVVLEGGDVRCWGSGEGGALGHVSDEDIGDDELPDSIGPVDVGAPVVQVTAGLGHTCALTVGGEVRCWGNNDWGQLGYGHTNPIGDDEPPSAAGSVSLGGVATQVAAGKYSTCALLEGGAVRCWGDNEYGQLGQGNRERIGDDELPTAVLPLNLGGAALQIVAGGGGQMCAWMEGGHVLCWGLGSGYGNIGGDTCAAFDYDDICDMNAVCCIGDEPSEMPPPPLQYR